MSYILHKGHPDREIVRANLHAFIDRLPESKSWEVTVAPYHKPRTAKQRRSLFGVAYKAIMEATGLRGSRDKERLHENMCGEFFGWKDAPMVGRVPVRTTTTNERGEREKITTLVALEMYAHIQHLAAEYGVDVPEPDPFWRQKAQREMQAAA